MTSTSVSKRKQVRKAPKRRLKPRKMFFRKVSDAAMDATQQICCKQNHLAQFDDEDKRQQLREIRNKYWSMSTQKKKRYLLDTYAQSSAAVRHRPQRYMLCGMQLCSVAFRQALGLSKHTHHKTLKEFREGAVTVHALPRPPRVTPAKLTAEAWMEQYIKDNGETIPNSTQIHISSSSRYKMHQLYATYSAKASEPFVKYQHFTKLMSELFPHVRFPRRKQFSKCGYMYLH